MPVKNKINIVGSINTPAKTNITPITKILAAALPGNPTGGNE
jgi:hypothetical protein